MLLTMTKQKYVIMHINITLASTFEWAAMTEGSSIASAQHPAAQTQGTDSTTVHTDLTLIYNPVTETAFLYRKLGQHRTVQMTPHYYFSHV